MFLRSALQEATHGINLETHLLCRAYRPSVSESCERVEDGGRGLAGVYRSTGHGHHESWQHSGALLMCQVASHKRTALKHYSYEWFGPWSIFRVVSTTRLPVVPSCRYSCHSSSWCRSLCGHMCIVRGNMCSPSPSTTLKYPRKLSGIYSA